jgi:hypothetical protein
MQKSCGIMGLPCCPPSLLLNAASIAEHNAGLRHGLCPSHIPQQLANLCEQLLLPCVFFAGTRILLSNRFAMPTDRPTRAAALGTAKEFTYSQENSSGTMSTLPLFALFYLVSFLLLSVSHFLLSPLRVLLLPYLSAQLRMVGVTSGVRRRGRRRSCR